METGRTSSVGNDILGFDSEGRVVNKTDGHGGLDWVHICRTSTKVITFIDLAGHEKYLKTTIFGMTGHAPDFCMLMIGSNAGIIGMTKGKCKLHAEAELKSEIQERMIPCFFFCRTSWFGSGSECPSVCCSHKD
jgi:GTPase